jgi:hypothetical protein
MKRRILSTILVAAALTAVGATPASAFPEQPGAHVERACESVNTNPGTGQGGVAEQHFSPTAEGILTGLIVDACFGG